MLFLGGGLGLVGGLTSLAQPLMAKYVIDVLEEGGSLVGPVLILTAVLLGGAALSAGGDFLLERTGQSVVLEVRRKLVGSLLTLHVSEVDRVKPGDLVSRMTADTTLLRTVATSGITNAFTSTVLLAGGVVVMAVLDGLLFLVTACMIVLVGVIMSWVLPRIGVATRASQEALGEMGSHLERIFGAFRTVKASSAEEAEKARLDVAAVEAWRRGVAVAGWTAVSGTAAWLALNAAFVAILAVGGGRVVAGELPISSLIAFLLLLFYMMEPTSMLVQSVTHLQTGLAAVQRIDEVSDLKQEETGAVPLSGEPGGPASVVFDEVAFRYRPELPLVHHSVSFEAEGSGLTALVGPSGAGKTTVFSLLERFYDTTAGRVLLDGQDVREWPLHALRAQVGYMEQDAPVLDGTLRDNLIMAAPRVTDQDLAEVVARARLTDLVSRLPQGLDSPIGHRGTTVSGGERQRVAIARALLRRPRVLLLDEATSQLDAANESALKEVLLDVARTTNVIVVAHRLSTVTNADRIVVMDAGRVRSIGTHEQLMSEDGLYRDLATEQLLVAGESMEELLHQGVQGSGTPNPSSR